MEFILFLSLSGATWDEYGPHFLDTADQTERYALENGWDDADLFEEDIVDINSRCGSLLNYGDIEYFDAEKCAKLIPWIEERLQRDTSPRYRELLEVLTKFCGRAVELQTGVYIDL